MDSKFLLHKRDLGSPNISVLVRNGMVRYIVP